MRDARYLLAHVLGCAAMDIVVESGNWIVDRRDQDRFEVLVQLREHGMPVDKILGNRGFWKGKFKVNDHVLSPRPETETIVEQVLKYKRCAQTILDLGVGSGCLLISLLREYPMARGVGVDISRAALEIARENSMAHNVEKRSEFLYSNWLEQVTGRFEIIVSNPPYIALGDMKDLPLEVKAHDPPIALCGGENGLKHYETLAKYVGAHLKVRGLLALEFGKGQSSSIQKIFERHGLCMIACAKDILGIDRVGLFSHSFVLPHRC